MADSASYESHEELTEFLLMLNNLFNQIQQSLSSNDPLGLEHCKSKVERCIPIVSAILLSIRHTNLTATENLQATQCHMQTLQSLVERLICEMEV